MKTEKRVRRTSVSRRLARGILLMDAGSTGAVLYLCWLSIRMQFCGSLPYLTTLIGALQAATAVVLSAYFGKSRAENTRGGIVYDAALGRTDAQSDLSQ